MKKLVALGLCLCFVSPLLAGPLDLQRVPAQAKWVLHIDMEKFVASKTGVAILEEASKQGLDIMLAIAKAGIGIDPVKDLKNATAYGTKFGDESGAMVLQGTLDKTAILKILKLKPSFKESKYGEIAVYQWENKTSKDKPAIDIFGAFFGDDTAVVATSQPILQQALDVLGGKGDNLAKAADKTLVIDKTAFIVAFVTKVELKFVSGIVARPDAEAALPATGQPAPALSNKLVAAQVMVGEKDNALWTKLSITAADDATATDLKQVGDGLLAFIRLAQLDAKTPTTAAEIEGMNSAEVLAIIKSLKVARDNMIVSIETSMPVQDVIKLIQAATKKKAGSSSASCPAPVSAVFKTGLIKIKQD